MSSIELQDAIKSKTKEQKHEVTSYDSNANTGRSEELSSNETTHVCTDSDTKAGGDCKTSLNAPAAAIMDTSNTEKVLYNMKSDRLENENNLCNETVTGGGDNESLRHSVSKNEIYNSPDFSMFNQTIQFMRVPQSLTETSTLATNSSEMMEEDMVLKWDDDDEETENVESKDEEVKSAEGNINPYNGDEEENEITVMEKQKSLIIKQFSDCVNNDQINKNEAQIDVEIHSTFDKTTKNCKQIVEKKSSKDESVIQEKVDPTLHLKADQNQINFKDSAHFESVTKKTLAAAATVDIEYESEDTQMDVEKVTISIDNIPTKLDHIINDKFAENKPFDKDNVDFSLDTNTDNNQMCLIWDDDYEEIEKVQSIDNEGKSTEEGINRTIEGKEENQNKDNSDLSLDTNTDNNQMSLIWDDDDEEIEKVQSRHNEGKSTEIGINPNIVDKEGDQMTVSEKQADVEKPSELKKKEHSDMTAKHKETTEINKTEESLKERQFGDCKNVEPKNKEKASTDLDKNTSVYSLPTNNKQLLKEKVSEDRLVRKEKIDPTLNTTTDQNRKKIIGSAEIESFPVNIDNKDSEKETEMDVNKNTTSSDNIITNLNQIIDDSVNKDESIIMEKIDPILDKSTDQNQIVLTDSTNIEAFTEKQFSAAVCKESEDTQMEVDKVISDYDNTITNLDQKIFDAIVNDKLINKDSAIDTNTDENQAKIKKDIDISVATVTEKKDVETTVTSVSLDTTIDNVLENKCADIIFPAQTISGPVNSSDLDMSTSDSFLDVTLEEREHNLNKPNMMTEIPTEDMIDFDDSINIFNDESRDLKNHDEIAGNSEIKEITVKTADNLDLLKIESEIKDIKNSNKILVKCTDQISAGIKSKEIGSGETETEGIKQIDPDQPVTEVSSINKEDSVVKMRKKTQAISDLIKPIKTIDQAIDQANDQQTKQTDKEVKPADIDEPVAMSSQMAPDTSDEVPEVTDSLGLLAESSRVMEDDEEQETSDHDEGDDEEDFDPDDESSNQMTAEHSEDSNAQQSESDIQKDVPITQADIETELEMETDNAQDFIEKIAETDEVATTADKEDEGNVENDIADKDGDVDIEEDMVIDEVDLPSDAVEDGVDVPDQALATLKTSTVAPTAQEVDNIEVVKESAKQVTSDIETVKLSDTSDTEEDGAKTKSDSILKELLAKSKDLPTAPETLSPAKTKKLEISKPKPPLSFVDLEESSSEDEPPTDIQEVPKDQPKTAHAVDDVTTVNIPSEIEIMSVGGNTSDIVTKEKEVVIKGVPKPPPFKPARLNTSEVTIKTTTANEPTPSLVIPEVKGDNAKYGLEVFNLDSDEEESPPAKSPTPPPQPSSEPEPQQQPEKRSNKCINDLCASASSAPHHPADRAAIAMYAPHHTRKAQVCERCALAVVQRSESLVADIRNLKPLLQLDMGRHRQELVEISDSDSEGEGEGEEEEKVTIGEKGAAMLEQLTEVINESWYKYMMDARLKEAEAVLEAEQELQEKELKELGQILDACQVATDKLRNELYATFEPEKMELPALVVYDTPDNMYSFVMPPQDESQIERNTLGQYKRRLSGASDVPNKKAAIPLGFTPVDEPKGDAATEPKPAPFGSAQDDKNDDDKDISVVKLSAESAPASLPPPGEPARPRVHVGMQVYAMRNAFGSSLRAKIVECTPKGTAPQAAQYSQFRVKFESNTHKNAYKVLSARRLAYSEPSEVRMTIGTRVIALFKESQPPKREAFYSGIVAEVPNPVNNFRYLVFFDDGYAQYVQHADTRLVCEFSSLVWEEVHPFSREFVRQYLLAYPERPMVRLHTGQSLKTEWNGKWWTCKVLQVDASLVEVYFEKDKRTEWIYRGSTRLAPLYLELQAAERHRARPLPRNRLANQTNMPYVEYTRSDEQQSPEKQTENIHTQIQAQEELRRQRAVAKKSTATPPQPPLTVPAPAPALPAHPAAEAVTSRVVYYTPKNAVKPYKMTTHTCTPKCKRSDVLSLKELRTYNPLAKPLLSGWERQIVRFKGHKEVVYRAPCGRRLRDMRELHRYLRTTKSEMPVDLFDFATTTHCLAEFVLNKCIVGKKDLSNGKENVPVPCVNYYDESLPEFCSYNTERTPTEGVPLNIDPDFLCGCDCTDDCEDKSKCACWKLTLEGARTIGLDGDVGYVYRRLPEPLPSGIYECNSKCKCKQTCLNRVAQHPLQLKLQVFKTMNRGWGIRALNDVPTGAFLCVYAGNLLTDATANLDGLNEGDEYLAELDYIEVVEQMKEGFEEDIPEADKRLDKKDSGQASSSSQEESSTEDEEQSRSEQNDGDFEPGYIGLGVQDYSKRLRKRDRTKKKDKNAPEKKKEGGEECITISDDEELREPARFAAQPGMGAEFISKYRSVRSYFGKDEACYIMDAKVQGNIGRYLNHSCSPNVFVQNVFVDTHDPRFPWVAFFALRPVRAGTELTWNYNYDVGSVPGKVLYCHCGAANCRGRLL